MILRDYQEDAIHRVRAAVAAGKRRVCLVMPTGAGKTHTGAAICALAAVKGVRSLWLAHRSELIDQAVESLGAHGIRAGAISAGARSAPNPHAMTQVASIQTLLARKLRPDAGIIIVDEAHHAPSAGFSGLLEAYPNATIVGLTATPERGDGLGLGETFNALVVGVRVKHLVETGALVHAEIERPDFQLRSGEIASRPVDAYLQHAAGLKAISFTNCVKAAVDHTADFEAAGIRSAYITGEMPAPKRAEILAAFRRGDIRVLNNVYVLTEGFDVPDTACCILARSCGTTGLYLQMVGRVLRPAPGKTRAVILDLHGSSWAHGHPEDNYEFSLDGEGVRSGNGVIREVVFCKVCKAPMQPDALACEECGTVREGIKAPTVVNVPLVKYAAKRAETPEAKAETLRRWARDMRSPGQLYHKFKSVYGHPPSWSACVEAMK